MKLLWENFICRNPKPKNLFLDARLAWNSPDKPQGPEAEKPAEALKTPEALPDMPYQHTAGYVEAKEGLDDLDAAKRAAVKDLTHKNLNTPPNQPPGSPDVGQKKPDEAKEKLKKPMSGTEVKNYLQAEEAKDQAAGMSPKERYQHSIQRMKELAAEQAKLGNVIHDGWTEIELGQVTLPDGRVAKIKTSVTNGPIRIGNEKDSFALPVDGPTGKIMAEAVGGMLMTLPVMNALEDKAKADGKTMDFISGPDVVDEIKSGKYGADIQQEFESLRDPTVTSSAMGWSRLVELRNKMYEQQLAAEDKKKIKWGFSKTVIMNPDQQDDVPATDKNGNSLRYSKRESLSIAGGLDGSGNRIQSGLGHPHDKSHLDYSQLAYAMNQFSVLEIDGKRYKVRTEDLLKSSDQKRIETVDGKASFLVPEAYKQFSDRPIDYRQIYPGVHLGTVPERAAAPVTEPEPEIEETPQVQVKSVETPKPQVKADVPVDAPSSPAVAQAPVSAPRSKPVSVSGNGRSTPIEQTTKPTQYAGYTSSDIRSPVREPAAPIQPTVASAPERSTESREMPKNGKFLVLGDSLSDGYQGAGVKGANVTPLLAEGRTDSKGQSTGDMLKILRNTPEDLCRGATLIVNGGANNIFNPDSLQQMKKDWTEICKIAREKKIKTIIGVTLSPLAYGATAKYWADQYKQDEGKYNEALVERWKDFNAWLKTSLNGPDKVVETDHGIFEDPAKPGKQNPEIGAGDGLHFSNYEPLAQAIMGGLTETSSTPDAQMDEDLDDDVAELPSPQEVSSFTKFEPESGAVPSGFKAITDQAEVTPELEKAAVFYRHQFLALYPKAEDYKAHYGEYTKFSTQDGREYLAFFEEHTKYGANPKKAPKPHPSIKLFKKVS